MITLAVNDRISYKGEKATVKQVWKKKVKVILSDLTEMTVGIDEIGPADEVAPGQLPLIDLSAYQLTDRPISQWDLENEDSIETPSVVNSDQSENAIETLTPDSDQSENAIDAIEIDVQSLPTYQLITLYEVIARELHYRDESECSLPNCLPNSHPNSLPNCLPNSHPNSLPNCLPNSHPNSLSNSHPNSHPNSLPNSLPNHGYEEIKTIKGRQYRYWRWVENDKLRSKYLGRCENDKKSC
ncbi:MAG: hypothetical protein EWV43_09835 [Microcystis panniformis Mp_MB_F_20080800_S26D]|nr:MAG: hypothetical protein EWV43_09835 [Microcystis panniformis Mp_MB_F_20080800_S26D]